VLVGFRRRQSFVDVEATGCRVDDGLDGCRRDVDVNRADRRCAVDDLLP
jgi:hypothetical protein